MAQTLPLLVRADVDTSRLAATLEAATGEPYDPWADAAQDPTTTPEG